MISIKKKFLFPLYFFSFFLSCKHSEKISSEKEVPKENKNTETSFSATPASNEAKVIATIISIDETRDSSDINSACYKAPCIAYIRLEKMNEKGSLFKVPPDLSLEIKVNFPFTLWATTEDLFPKAGKQFPGLKINDKFEAIIQSRMAPGDEVNYVIYEYKKKPSPALPQGKGEK